LNIRDGVLGLVTLAAVATALSIAPVPQDPAYHDFADQRTILGIAHFWNVASNLPFLLVGALGLAATSRLHAATHRPAYLIYCTGVMLVALGSTWYHLAPSTETLLWDRLPMTVAFMAFLAMVIGDRISSALGRTLLWPLLAAGAASVGYWYWSELAGRGDLRPYGLVQFLPMLLIAILLLMSRGPGLRGGWVWASLAFYAAAKLAEFFDAGILGLTSGFSGHSLKHLLAAVAAGCTLRSSLESGRVLTR